MLTIQWKTREGRDWSPTQQTRKSQEIACPCEVESVGRPRSLSVFVISTVISFVISSYFVRAVAVDFFGGCVVLASWLRCKSFVSLVPHRTSCAGCTLHSSRVCPKSAQYLGRPPSWLPSTTAGGAHHINVHKPNSGRNPSSYVAVSEWPARRSISFLQTTLTIRRRRLLGSKDSSYFGLKHISAFVYPSSFRGRRSVSLFMLVALRESCKEGVGHAELMSKTTSSMLPSPNGEQVSALILFSKYLTLLYHAHVQAK